MENLKQMHLHSPTHLVLHVRTVVYLVKIETTFMAYSTVPKYRVST